MGMRCDAIGGKGDDTYVVDSAGDTVTEKANEGNDTIQTNLTTYTLVVNVENLTKLIQLKVDGQEIVQAPDPEEPKILNLMDALKKGSSS